MLFRIHRLDGNLRYIKDVANTLLDANDEPCLTIGIGEAIDAQQWHELQQQGFLIEPNQQLKSIFDILKNEFGGLSIVKEVKQDLPIDNAGKKLCVYFDGEKIVLSLRQTQCLEFLLQGYSTKEIAFRLHLSTRTVE